MPSLPNIHYEAELIDALENLIKRLPGIKFRKKILTAPANDKGVDVIFLIEVRSQPIRVVAQVKKTGYPRDLRHDVSQLADIAVEGSSIETVPLIAAPSVSPGSRELFQQKGVGYFDSGGSLYLPLSNGIYFIDRKAPIIDRRLHSLYRGRSAQVLHVLIAKHNHSWHVNELAEEAEVSPYTVHQVFTFLEKQLWVEREGKGPECVRILRAPGALLDAWAENYSQKLFEFRNYFSWSHSFSSLRQQVCANMEEHGVDYALTLSSGAEMVAPFATGVDRLHLIVPATAKLDDAVTAAGLKPVEDGANITLMVTRQHAPLLLRHRIEEIWVASDIQLYLDLQNWPARGKEQAEYLRKERLRF